MTLAPTLLRQGPTSDVSNPVPSVPSRNEVLTAIIIEARYFGLEVPPEQAGAVDDMFARMADAALVGRDEYILSDDEMRVVHPVIDLLVPDEQEVPNPGSVHALLNGRHQMTFVHTMSDDGFCSVTATITVSAA